MRGSLVKDGAWVATTQVFAAIGQILGIRILTEILPPSVFGSISLWLGVIALAASAIANPTMQALLRFYPEYVQKKQGGLVRLAARKQLFSIFSWVSPIFIIALYYSFAMGWADIITVILLVVLVLIEIGRMQYMALLNAIRAQRVYGAWLVMEAWGRPLLAWCAVYVFGVSVHVVLTAFLIASALTLMIMRRKVPSAENEGMQLPADLRRQFWRYSLPLLPLGLIGWLSGMANRYIIGVLMKPADVGLYVAIYGLASRPMLMLGNIVETTIRPAYQQAVAARDHMASLRYVHIWGGLVLAGSLIALAISMAGHSYLANLLLGEGYRDASFLFPWIVGGYSLLILSHIPQRVCYANGATRRVLVINICTAIMAIVLGFLFVDSFGLLGAAIAVPVYFGGQFILSVFLAQPWLRMGANAGVREQAGQKGA